MKVILEEDRPKKKLKAVKASSYSKDVVVKKEPEPKKKIKKVKFSLNPSVCLDDRSDDTSMKRKPKLTDVELNDRVPVKII